MTTRTLRRAIAGIAVTALFVTACGGDDTTTAPDASEPAPTATGADPEPTGAATTDPPAAADRADAFTTAAVGPSGWTEGEARSMAGADGALIYAYETVDLERWASEQDAVDRLVAAGFTAGMQRRWDQTTGPETANNIASVFVAEFSDDAAAAAEFALQRGFADQAIAAGEMGATGSSSDAEFTVSFAGGGMVQIDPNTGQPVDDDGPTRQLSIGAQLHGRFVVVVSTFFADGTTDDGSTFSTLWDSMPA